MSIIAWVILGLIAGFIASKIVNKSGQGMLMDIVLGIVGAVVGGVVFNFFGAAGVTGLNLYSFIVAIAGAVIVLWIYHAVSR
ncbi:GlsB/YeaQ/YmgE family stress response membrane protein [Methyloligella sp. 2.7D]|uniref:GlsB/YeaQ/YmgE family stress response membrane protein n=1 Tax=unclassified Methyloligella TaxID=2625955 RepID=UPI00157DB5B9|nr:GlsB/YeaQ/YmgE family stress response membrane protein [Methyloligella sp. GL2]QKP76914.1 GlsB/YeaQ/YmgE family stress response membrane protein [Methyloligella sp. GL2]